MPYMTQAHILELSATCRTVRKLVVFRDDKWNKPHKGYFHIDILNSSSFSLATPVLF
jgi:hypothetical protein